MKLNTIAETGLNMTRLPNVKLKNFAPKVMENPMDSMQLYITDSNNKAGEILGRTQILINSAITDKDFAKMKEILHKRMLDRNFSPERMDSILDSIEKKSAKLATILVGDKYAHSDDINTLLLILWNLERARMANGTPAYNVNYALLEEAAIKRNYSACFELCDDYMLRREPRFKHYSEIEDKTSDVTKRGEYMPKWASAPAISKDELKKQTAEIIDLLKRKNGWCTGAALQFERFINPENIELIKVLAGDKDAQLGFIKFASEWCNSENAELMLRAALNKDYHGICHIAGYSHTNGNLDGFLTASLGKIRIHSFDTIDARYAGFKRDNTNHNISSRQETFYANPRYTSSRGLGATIRHELNSTASFHDIVREYCTDDISSAAKVLLEDPIYDNELAAKVLQKMNIDNVESFKSALLNRDFVTLEKLCGEKISSKDLSKDMDNIKIEIKPPVSSTGRISRETFVNYMDDRILHTKGFKTSLLKDSEVRNLAKLFGTTEEQIRNMDKKEYRRLCIQTHPDRNANDKLAPQVFRILNSLFTCQ